MKNKNFGRLDIPLETKKKIALANSVNPYVDITPFELKIGCPFVNYQGLFMQPGEIVVYATPAYTFVDKNQVVGYTGKSSGVSVRVAKGVTFRSGGSGGRTIRDNVRNFHGGDLVITNMRVLFIGKDDRFEFPVNKISAAKILDASSFVIQSGRTSKNIAIDEAHTVYALGFINYVVSEYSEGNDVLAGITQERNAMTAEQIQLCSQIKQETQQIKIPKQNNKNKNSNVRTFSIVIMAICFIIVFAILLNSNKTTTASTSSSRQVDVIVDATQFAYISQEELIEILGEPTLIEEKVAGIGDTYAFHKSFNQYNRTIVCYENKDASMYHFLIINDKVYSFQYYAPIYSNPGTINKYYIEEEDLFIMFGIEPSEDVIRGGTSRYAIVYENVTDEIFRFEVHSVDPDKKTFETVVIRYDIRDNPIEASTVAVCINLTYEFYYHSPKSRPRHYFNQTQYI